MSCCVSLAGYAALAFVAYRLLRILSDVFFPYFIGPALGLNKKIHAFAHAGEYAVVTGATDGIGKGYAKELAKQGFKLILISRNQDKLNSTAQEIEQLVPGTEIRTIQFDFTETDANAYGKIKEGLKGFQISILVNNVGMGYPYPERIAEIQNGDKVSQDLLNVNGLSAVMMARIVVPRLLELKRGVVINISSASARFAATPYLGIYSATKKFLAFITDSLRVEYEGSGICFQTVFPFFVATKMAKIKKPRFFAPDPDVFARSALGTVGVQNDTVGCFPHAVQEAGIRIAMLLQLEFVFQKAMTNAMKALRKKALDLMKQQ